MDNPQPYIFIFEGRRIGSVPWNRLGAASLARPFLGSPT